MYVYIYLSLFPSVCLFVELCVLIATYKQHGQSWFTRGHDQKGGGGRHFTRQLLQGNWLFRVTSTLYYLPNYLLIYLVFTCKEACTILIYSRSWPNGRRLLTRQGAGCSGGFTFNSYYLPTQLPTYTTTYLSDFDREVFSTMCVLICNRWIMLRMYNSKKCEWVSKCTLLWKDACYLSKRPAMLCLAKLKTIQLPTCLLV